MTKQETRKHFRELRAQLDPADIGEMSEKIAVRVMKAFGQVEGTWHVFLSISRKDELDTEFLVNRLWRDEKHVVTSVTHEKSKRLTHHRLEAHTRLKESSWGIPEPIESPEVKVHELDVVIVPLLAFDKRGHRVGYGKGLYDSFLNTLRPDTLTIGLSLFEPVEPITDVWQGDVPLNACVTPYRVYQF